MAVLKRFSVYAVEDTTVQLSWGDLGPGPHRLSVGGHEIDCDGVGAGTALFDGLTAATTYDVIVDGKRAGRATTLSPPPGALVMKVATVSDCHLFEDGFGAVRHMKELGKAEHYTTRCLRAALTGAVAWGADLIVAKGDLTDRARPLELATSVRLLQATNLPVVVVPGNHEVKRRTQPWTVPIEAAGFAVSDHGTGRGVVVRDLPAVRLIGADTTIHGHHSGTFLPSVRSEILEAVAEAGGPVLLCIHHQLEPARIRCHYPPGIGHAEATEFLDALVRIRPDVWVTSGHTHRSRARRYGPLVITEVGSNKDGAGCWAGYAVYEGGIRQVLRRVTGDDTDAWLDRSRRALGGLWGIYAPGRLRDRCLTHAWLNPG